MLNCKALFDFRPLIGLSRNNVYIMIFQLHINLNRLEAHDTFVIQQLCQIETLRMSYKRGIAKRFGLDFPDRFR